MTPTRADLIAKPEYGGSLSRNVRRLRRVLITPQIFIEFMKHGGDAVSVVQHELPDDAEYVGASFDPLRLSVWLFVSSREFEEVAEHDPVPEHPAPVFQKRGVETLRAEGDWQPIAKNAEKEPSI